MNDEARITFATSADGHLEVRGEIDAHSADMFADSLGSADPSTGVLVVDMSGVTFMDSSGLRVLLAAAQRSESGGPTLRIAQPSRSIVRLFEVSGLADHFDIVHSDVA